MCVIDQRCGLYKFEINLSISYVIDFMNFVVKFTWCHSNDFSHVSHGELLSITIIINLSKTKNNHIVIELL